MADPLPAPDVGVSEPSRGGVTRGGIELNAVHSRHLILIDQMIAWSLSNPGKPWTDCARALGVSTLWCRMVASSDAFQARYKDVKNDVIEKCGLMTLKDKISAAAEIAVERIAEKAAISDSMGDLTDAAEVLLGAVYGKGGAQPTGPATVTVNAAVIIEARDRLLNREAQPPAIEVQPETKES